MYTGSSSTISETTKTAGWIIGVLLFAVFVSWFLYAVVLNLDTSVQPLVRTDITHQASRVIATQQKMVQDCADIRTDSINITLAQANITAFKSSHNMKNLSATDSLGLDDLQTNLTGAQVALTTLEQSYTAEMSNPDNTVNLTVSLPSTYQGCLVQ